MKLRSYAKVNLTLDILGKRNDGYHELETVFQQIELYDDVELEEIDEDKILIECNVKEIENEDNLAYKAASLLKEKYDVKKGIRIKIEKIIPIGAGLSGGSSNAAAVLKGLNSFWELGVDKKELISIGKELGMDVAFHILGGTCLGKGRGEILEKIKDLDKYHVIVVYPGFSINTKEAYSKLDYDKIGKEKSSERFVEEYDTEYLHNDFEYSILEKYPEIRKLKEEIGESALLSGSGSSVFGLFKDENKAKAVYDELKRKYKEVFLTKTWNKRIELAKEMGFCFGVKRAIEEINKIDNNGNLYVLGKLIHNPQVISQIEERGIKMIDDFNDIDEGTIVISAHGVADKVIEEIKAKGLKVIDLTCPLVKKVHDITKEEEKKGRKIIVFGDKDHTEVKGIIGNLSNYRVISDMGDLSKEDLNCKLTIVSQTTRETDKFQEISRKINDINKDTEIRDTICIATKERQSSSIELAKKSDIMIVIGGKISSNTKRLEEVCGKYCETRHIETEKELNNGWFVDKEKIGITAGASTPDWIIKAIHKKVSIII
ncbi:MAG: 4-(cytidine 5'-diphospho)-2-C-methyl-D-erythritol kinase [Nanoarchaeota archaeon]|nr:4-(cytidine 5'-diphospho)-2-C-methyl-D-erythritol kinase [Nanoarchaeota archaeon]